MLGTDLSAERGAALWTRNTGGIQTVAADAVYVLPSVTRTVEIAGEIRFSA